ncbi:hypothetical protein [Pseudoxanthomonas indica]|uniref:Uncharacterized protein n=1 Tax=Pseudoxanthomonas indica TaxID=428993 RepID=A0A1T5LR32_9GAMM|nr:hypothetical protein [Pseudoxanthomonas indica]GGD38612.1 hypothetical protein GCM10007235_08420 [Pseudoxanthomonas indica]SKC78487.1 hypothetical protein SAMN06296058_2963 [Pseudoxanthomonas indica]
MKALLLAVCTAVLVCLAGTGHAQDAKRVAYTDIRVAQFRPGSHISSDHPWTNVPIAEQCRAAPPGTPTTSTPPVAPLVAAVGGIIITWLFERAVGAVSKRAKEAIKKYTATSANEPVYANMLDGRLWKDGESCVLMQRVHCSAPAADVEAGRARCLDGKVGLTLGLRLKQQADYLRVLPYAEELAGLQPGKPAHDGGDVSLAATFRIEAFGRNADGSGTPWKSPDLVVASIDCDTPGDRERRKSRKDAKDVDTFRAVTTTCAKDHLQGLSWEDRWKYAHLVLPNPPATEQAFVFTLAEVGKPSRGLKYLDEFLDASGSDVSAALSEALQKKVKLKEE